MAFYLFHINTFLDLYQINVNFVRIFGTYRNKLHYFCFVVVFVIHALRSHIFYETSIFVYPYNMPCYSSSG